MNKYNLPMDNPESRYHGQYHRIVDRVASSIIHLLICGLMIEVVGTWWAALMYPIAICTIVVLWLLGIGIATMLVYIVASSIEFFSGY
jgi:hypothetical protein